MPNVIIVDDNPLNLETLAVLLNKEGVTPIMLESPRELETILDEASVAAVFLDLEFPNYDGLELVQVLKADPRLTGVPIVAYTVHTSEQNEARSAGFDSFIGKPLNVERFPEQLRRILNGQPVWETN